MNNPKLTEYYLLLKKRTLLTTEKIAKNEVISEKSLQIINDQILTLTEPELIAGESGLELKYEKNFEELCVFIAQHGNQRPKELTTLEFFTTYYTIEKQLKAQKNGKQSNH